MADLNGAGSTTLGGLSGTADGHVEWWHVALAQPNDGDAVPTTAPTLTFIADTWDGRPVDVQIQVSASSGFASTLLDQTISAPDGPTTGVQATGLSDGGTYYFRARALAPDGYVGDWTATRSFSVDLTSGHAVEYVTLNVGVAVTLDPSAAEQIYENVGVEPTPEPGAAEQVYENVGIEVTLEPHAAEYLYEGDVSTNTPTPRIWFLKPTSGRAGDGIDIYGWGFGDLQTTYTGIVEVDFGDGLGWVGVPAVSWQTFPATADAYTAGRTLDPVFGEIDMQHTVIGILVPADAIPPGYPVRVRTNGP